MKGIGDINSDGIDDLFVAQYSASDTWGIGYIYFGSHSFDTVADVIFNANKAETQFAVDGGSACNIGDITGDGYPDLLVGVPAANAESGKISIFRGGPSIHNVADGSLVRTGSGGHFGDYLYCGADLNGDGSRDAAIGSYDSRSGSVHLYFGGALWDATRDLLFDEMNDSGETFFGYNAMGHADVNGDGYDDPIIGMPASGSIQRKAFVYYGGATPNATADVTWLGLTSGAFGGWPSGIPDINGDGFDEAVIANQSTGNGSISVFRGGSPPASTAAQVLTGEMPADSFGSTAVGDFNGDGLPELIVGAQNNDAAGTDAGKAYIYGLSASGGGSTPGKDDATGRPLAPLPAPPVPQSDQQFVSAQVATGPADYRDGVFTATIPISRDSWAGKCRP